MRDRIRLIRPGDAPELARLLVVNRAFLAPWEPDRDEDYFTPAGQSVVVRALLQQHEQGAAYPCVILDTGRVVGRITLNGIVRGPLQSCSVGYWVGAADNGRGVASDALRCITRIAFEDLRLHRVQAEALPHNLASQRVLERNGFTRFGYAEKYLHIAGEWQDCVMYQLLTPGTMSP